MGGPAVKHLRLFQPHCMSVCALADDCSLAVLPIAGASTPCHPGRPSMSEGDPGPRKDAPEPSITSTRPCEAWLRHDGERSRSVDAELRSAMTRAGGGMLAFEDPLTLTLSHRERGSVEQASAARPRPDARRTSGACAFSFWGPDRRSAFASLVRDDRRAHRFTISRADAPSFSKSKGSAGAERPPSSLQWQQPFGARGGVLCRPRVRHTYASGPSVL